MKQIFQNNKNNNIKYNINSNRGLIMLEIKEFLKNLFGTIKGVFRLILVTITFFLSGLNNVVFAGREICGFQFTYDFLSQDIDKLSYIDKLNLQLEDDMEEEDGEFLFIEEDEDGDFE